MRNCDDSGATSVIERYKLEFNIPFKKLRDTVQSEFCFNLQKLTGKGRNPLKNVNVFYCGLLILSHSGDLMEKALNDYSSMTDPNSRHSLAPAVELLHGAGR